MPTINTPVTPCECDSWDTPGIIFPAITNSDPSRAWVEACDRCDRYKTDDDAAHAIAAKLETTVAWAHPGDSENFHPFLDLPDETATIHIVEPADGSHDLVAFHDQADAERFADTFERGMIDGDGTSLHEATLLFGQAAIQAAIDRRQEQYEAIGEMPVQEIDPEDIGRYIVSCGSMRGDREVVHVTAETEAEVLALAAEDLSDGWHPVEIHDLNAGTCRQLTTTTAVVPVA